MSKTAIEVENYIVNRVMELGCEIVDVDFLKKPEHMTLTVYITKEGGVSIEDCERVHKGIDALLDELDPTDGLPYTLNVSSPGLDRTFRRPSDFERNMGKMVVVKLYAPLEGRKEYEGILSKYSADLVTITMNEVEKVFQMSTIAKISLKIEF